MEDEPNGDAAVVAVDDPKMEGVFAAVEVAPPPKIDPDVRVPRSDIFVEEFQPRAKQERGHVRDA